MVGNTLFFFFVVIVFNVYNAIPRMKQLPIFSLTMNTLKSLVGFVTWQVMRLTLVATGDVRLGDVIEGIETFTKRSRLSFGIFRGNETSDIKKLKINHRRSLLCSSQRI